MQLTTAHKRAIDSYYKELSNYHTHKVTHETAVRSAFQDLLKVFAQSANWILIPEQTLANGKRPDATLRDTFNLPRGYWEAKDTKDDLNAEIRKKITLGYPITNTIFEDTRRAVLYQNNKPLLEADLTNQKHLIEILDLFFHYAAPDVATFEHAVQDFKESIPDLAQGLMQRIQEEHAYNKSFGSAFSTFLELCRTSLDPNMSSSTVDEMLIQHLLTERLFRTIFDNPDFINRNIIASEIEKVIQALTSRSFNRREFLKSLDRFYLAIENAARNLDDWSEKQSFLNTIYERFFQGFSIKQADTHGIVYTPQEIVDFMCSSVDVILQRDFDSSLSTPGVQILDPATGTGNFIVNLIQRISGSSLVYKYEHDLFCNEIMLLPYYIASLNIEHAYYERMGQYKGFDGISFADTLNLEGQQMELFSERNTERIQRQRSAQIVVVIGNPPYNMGQRNENDNNQNRRYPVVDRRINRTYVKDSKATLNNKLYDSYVKFFRWAVDRLQGRDGIVCFVSNNSFVHKIAFDGMRKHLQQDFTQIYHLDLQGDVQANQKLSGTAYNVFGIQVGVGVTIAVRRSNTMNKGLYYYSVPETWRRKEKLAFLIKQGDIKNIDWLQLTPDDRHNWLTEGMHSEFTSFFSLGTKATKSTKGLDAESIFKLYSLGVVTSRDSHAYAFDAKQLQHRAEQFVDVYNSAVDKLKRQHGGTDYTSFIDTSDSRIKWTRQVKGSLLKLQYSQYSKTYIRNCLYRPFTRKKIYFDDFWNEERYQQPLFFPVPSVEKENVVITVSDHGHRAAFSTLAANSISDLHLLASTDAFQCFPYYTYAEDGSNRHENVTDWVLAQFRTQYGEEVIKWDIFHYVYALLHHPVYRERYAENLKRDLPHIPLLSGQSQFETCIHIGKQLMELHLNYEETKEYPLTWLENKDVPINWHVERMKLTHAKDAVIVNNWLTLAGIPQECFQYRLGNRSALEWVIDQYQVSVDTRSGITSDPNYAEDEEYIVRLVGQVVTVSVETMKLVEKLTKVITQENWVNQEVEE